MNKRPYALADVAALARKSVLEMAYNAKSAHTGGSLSCVEILTTLYFAIMKVDPLRPFASERDRLVFSKAHDCKALFAVLAERGFFPKSKLSAYEQDGGLPGHATRTAVPGVEISAGSLGHGLSIATGMALSARLDQKKHRVFAVLSDGECDEGSTWEAALFAGHHHLDNLVAIVDYNKIQSYGRTEDVLDLEPFISKWQSFRWEALEVDGHDTEKLTKVLQKIPYRTGKPSVLIAHTIKGNGGPINHRNKVSSHYKPPTKEEFIELFAHENI